MGSHSGSPANASAPCAVLGGLGGQVVVVIGVTFWVEHKRACTKPRKPPRQSTCVFASTTSSHAGRSGFRRHLEGYPPTPQRYICTEIRNGRRRIRRCRRYIGRPRSRATRAVATSPTTPHSSESESPTTHPAATRPSPFIKRINFGATTQGRPAYAAGTPRPGLGIRHPGLASTKGKSSAGLPKVGLMGIQRHSRRLRPGPDDLRAVSQVGT